MTTVAEAIAAPASLDRHVARMVGDEPTINDVASVLHLLASADEVDGVRIQALCYAASRALGKFDGHTRHAPPSALAELVRDSLVPCGATHLGCLNEVAVWDDEFCGPRCQVDHMRSQGETWDGDR